MADNGKTIRPDLQRLADVKLVVFDFDGVFTNNRVYVDENGVESVLCSRLDGLGLEKLKKLNVYTCVLSSEVNPVVTERCRKLDIPVVQGSKNKIADLKKLVVERRLNADTVVYVGNDINDLDCLLYVGFPFVVLDSHGDVLKYDFSVCEKKGGDGAVREVCDLIAIAKNGGFYDETKRTFSGG